MSLCIDSRKNRSSSTTDTNGVFGIGFRQFARTAMRAAPNNVIASTCEFHNVREDTARAMPAARKLWLMQDGTVHVFRLELGCERHGHARTFEPRQTLVSLIP